MFCSCPVFYSFSHPYQVFGKELLYTKQNAAMVHKCLTKCYLNYLPSFSFQFHPIGFTGDSCNETLTTESPTTAATTTISPQKEAEILLQQLNNPGLTLNDMIGILTRLYALANPSKLPCYFFN